MKSFKVSIDGAAGEEDEMFVQAESQQEAEVKLAAFVGEVPSHLLAWKEIQESDLPEGVEFL